MQAAMPLGVYAKAPPLAHLARTSDHSPALSASRPTLSASRPTLSASRSALGGGTSRSALVVLLAHRGRGSTGRAESDAVERELLSIPGLSVGLFSTAQGGYNSLQLLRDIERAARLADTVASPLRLQVLSVQAGGLGRARLLALVRARRTGELVLAIEQASGPRAHELHWIALTGPAGASRSTLSSQTTEQRGIVAAVDVAPTLLGYLGLPIAAATQGKPIHLDGALDGGALRSLKARLEVVYPRRLPALACLLAAWALLLASIGLAVAASRPDTGAEAAPGSERRRAVAADTRVRWAIRVGALAMLWAPVAVLVPAALEPSAGAEYALIVVISFALAALTDAVIDWPRAPIAPAATAVLAITVDALAGTQLLMRSLLGPNPAYGARFYGIGNELKSGLAVLVFAAVAAALYPATRSRRTAATMASVGALLALVEGAARIGAGVGGVILVCAGTAVATVMLLPGPLRRGRILAVMAAPLVGLLALAIVDLATAHGAGHFTGSVLDARSVSDIQDLIVRRYEAAWQELGNGLMPLLAALALLLTAAAVRYRERLLWPVQSDPAWLAALAGGLTAGLVGALSEDSGPVLLVVAVFVIACVVAYVYGWEAAPPSDGACGPSPATARRRPTSRTISTTMITTIRIPPAM
ncbi:MAG TPA: hypothetical protein VHS55_06300 [Solirubrobacteraceae bacterium]|nr:hypothetical protein [Solirubrobacteraceae bacterium]